MNSQRFAALCATLFLSIAAVSPASATATLAPEDFSSTAEYARVLRSFNPGLSRAQSRAFADRVRLEADYYRLDARLLVALVATESSWHPYATSPVGAGGLGQLMPGTAAGLGVNAYSPYANLNGTAHYLRGLLDRFSGYNQSTRYAFALAGYNAGPAAVERFGGIPPYTETQNYVRNVMGIWHRLSLSLSSHIDDYVRTPSYRTNPQRPIILAQAAPKVSVHARAKRKHTTAAKPAVTIIAAAPATPAPARHKPFLYYLFHRHHDATTVAQAANGMGPDPASIDASARPSVSVAGAPLGLSVPASVSGGHPIPVSLAVAANTPVTIMAFVGDVVVSQGTIAAHRKRGLLHGVAAADAARIVVVRAYAQGYNEAHAALTIAAAAPKVAQVAPSAKLVEER